MFQSTKVPRILAATFALALVAGCADQAPRSTAKASPSPAAAEASPELAGAWYQVFFDTNKTDIDSRGQMIVKNVAYVVANTNAARVTVVGKTDRAGDGVSNMALSQHRANQVRDALVAAGVPASRIDTSWTGEGKPEIATPNDASESRNRVVDITVIKPLGTAFRQGN
jgi:OOP family OmpA-OmpF porin